MGRVQACGCLFLAFIHGCGGGGTDATTADEDGSTALPGDTVATDGTSSPGDTVDDDTADATTNPATTAEPTTGMTTDTPPSCGDGVAEGDEACDDANQSNADDCVQGCQAAACGDGFVHEGVEACDDGNADNSDSCLDTCVAAGCGDGILGPGELCDDGNQVDDDECTGACTLASCGDGKTDPGEPCDDGNDVDTDACLSTCTAAACGDGVVQEGVEACDDGNGVDDDTCTSACVTTGCEDAALNGDETDIDCGGPACPACADGESCGGNADCSGGVCDAGVCGGGLALPDCPDMAVDAATVWEQVVSKNCGLMCHLNMGVLGGLNMKDAATMKANLVDVPSTQATMDRVSPGAPSGSYLIYKITNQQNLAPMGGGSDMPVGMPLSDAEKCLVIDWVRGGAI